MAAERDRDELEAERMRAGRKVPLACVAPPATTHRSALGAPSGAGSRRRPTEMSSFCMPMLIVNMGGEMVYILEQRLHAQNVPLDKSKRGAQLTGEPARTNHPRSGAIHAHTHVGAAPLSTAPGRDFLTPLTVTSPPSLPAAALPPHPPELIRRRATPSQCSKTLSALCTTRSSSLSSSAGKTCIACNRRGRSSTSWHTRPSCDSTSRAWTRHPRTHTRCSLPPTLAAATSGWGRRPGTPSHASHPASSHHVATHSSLHAAAL